MCNSKYYELKSIRRIWNSNGKSRENRNFLTFLDRLTCGNLTQGKVVMPLSERAITAPTSIGRIITRFVFAVTLIPLTTARTTAREQIFSEANRLLYPVPAHTRALAPPVRYSFDFSASAEWTTAKDGASVYVIGTRVSVKL